MGLAVPVHAFENRNRCHVGDVPVAASEQWFVTDPRYVLTFSEVFY